jgi:DNA-binding IclR family transcriptional regulator
MLQTVNRAGRVLDLFSAEDPEWGASAVARELDVAKSQAHALLVSLTDIGLLERVRSGRYRLGWRLLALSSLLPDTSGLRTDAAPGMQALLDRFGETVQLAVWGAQRAICIAARGGRVRDAVAPPSLGDPLPMHATAIGKVLLASRPWDDVEYVVGRDGLAPLTGATLATLGALWPELARVRARGFALEDAEHAPGTCAVAAPVFDRPGVVVAAIAVSVPAARWEAHRDELARAMVITAAHVSRRACRRTAAGEAAAAARA